MGKVVKKQEVIQGEARPFRLRVLMSKEEGDASDYRVALAAKEIVEVVKRHHLAEGEMFSAVGTASAYCVMERTTI